MAFSTQGIIEIEKKLNEFNADIPQVKKALLDIGGEKATEIWKEELKQNTMPNGTPRFWLRYRRGNLQEVHYKSRSTGAMNKSVGYKTRVSMSLSEIYPQGSVTRGKGKVTRNALKAFVMNYGKSGQVEKNFLPKIDEDVSDKAIVQMKRTLNNYLKSKGLI